MMLFDKTAKMGYGAIFLYCLCTASGMVLVSYFQQSLTPLLVTFYTFLISIVACSLANIRHTKMTFKLAKKHIQPVVYLNISTAITWVCTFVALKLLSPSIATSLILGMFPITTFFIMWRYKTDIAERRWELLFTLLIAGMLFSLIVYDLFEVTDIRQTAVGMVIAIFAGIAGACNNIFAKKLSQHQFPTLSVLSLRFILLIVIVSAGLFFMDWDISVSSNSLLMLGVIALMTVMLPLFFLQKGLEKVDALHVAFLSAFIPVLTYFIQFLNPIYSFQVLDFVLISLLCLAICGPALRSYWKSRQFGNVIFQK